MMPSNPTLYTSRFTLIPIRDTADSNRHLIEMMKDARVQKYIHGQAYEDSEITPTLERFHRINQVNGLGLWLIMNSDNQCAGMCILKPLPTEQKAGHIETGYWLKPDFWGNGIAAEVASKMVDYAFNQLQLTAVTAVVDERNTASIKSLERAGLTHRGTISAYERELPFYKIDNPDLCD